MRQGDEILNLLLWPRADYVVPVHKLHKASHLQVAPEQESEEQEPLGGEGAAGVHARERKALQTLGVARKGSPASD